MYDLSPMGSVHSADPLLMKCEETNFSIVVKSAVIFSDKPSKLRKPSTLSTFVIFSSNALKKALQSSTTGTRLSLVRYPVIREV